MPNTYLFLTERRWVFDQGELEERIPRCMGCNQKFTDGLEVTIEIYTWGDKILSDYWHIWCWEEDD